jgi:uncharacterized lipoprotein YddW (UPF0748 family)
MFRSLLRILILLPVLLFAGITSAPAQSPPSAPREFRGMWIATVWNVDWPTRKGLSADQMRSEMQTLIQAAKSAGMNAIVLQVRSYSDAIYPSSIDPWSEFLTGTMGQAPGGNFDPLQYAVEECHRQGLLIHCWVNPFRAGVAKTVASNKHISRRHPEVVRSIGGRLWADPGEPVARKVALDVVRDIVTRYNVDGIQYDDKGFYPYPAELKDWGGLSDFPDDASYQRYGRRYRNKGDWRRANITSFLEESNQVIKSVRSSVMLGVSPFGIHKAGEPAGIVGTSAHDVLYTDCKTWMRQGLVDYMAPQLYWPIESKGQPYEPLLRWWAAQNTGRRHLWPGIRTEKFDATEIINQINIARNTRGVTGHIHYTGFAIRRNINGKMRDSLAQGPFSYPALIPTSPWLGSRVPGEPVGTLSRDGDGFLLRLSPVEQQPRPFLYTVYAQTASGWSFAVVPGASGSMRIPSNQTPRTILVAAVDRLGNESRKVQVPLQ